MLFRKMLFFTLLNTIAIIVIKLTIMIIIYAMKETFYFNYLMFGIEITHF